MGKREDKGGQVVYKNPVAGHTDVWHKNSVGNTTKEGYRRVEHGSGKVTDHKGHVIHKGR